MKKINASFWNYLRHWKKNKQFFIYFEFFFFHFQSVKPCSNLKKINNNNLKTQCDFPKIIGTFLDSFWFLGIFRYERRPTSLLLFLLVAAASPLAFLAWNGGVLWHFFWKLLEKDPQLIIREWNLFQKIKQHTHTQCSSTLGSFMYSVVSADSQNQRDFTFIFLSTWVHFLMQQSLAKLTWGCEAKGISTLVFKIWKCAKFGNSWRSTFFSKKKNLKWEWCPWDLFFQKRKEIYCQQILCFCTIFPFFFSTLCHQASRKNCTIE